MMAKDKTQLLQSVLGSILQSPTPSKEKKGSGLTTGRAALLGAGLFAAGRLTANRGNGGIVASLQNRLEGALGDDDEDYEEPEGYEDEEGEEEEEEDDEE